MSNAQRPVTRTERASLGASLGASLAGILAAPDLAPKVISPATLDSGTPITGAP